MFSNGTTKSDGHFIFMRKIPSILVDFRQSWFFRKIKKKSKLAFVLILRNLTQFVKVNSFNTQLTTYFSYFLLKISFYFFIISSILSMLGLGILYLTIIDSPNVLWIIDFKWLYFDLLNIDLSNDLQ